MRKWFPNARIVADRFHIVRVLQHHFLDLSRRIVPELKNHRGLLGVLRRHPSKLNERQQVRLQKLLVAYPALQPLYQKMVERWHLLRLKHQTASRHAYVTKADGPRFRWDDEKGMHVSISSVREERAVEISERIKAYAEEAFRDGALKYVAARKAIMHVAAVKDSRAETMLKDMVKAGIVTKDITGFYGLKA